MNMVHNARGLLKCLGPITRSSLLVGILIALPTISEPVVAQQKAKQQKSVVQQDDLMDQVDLLDKQEQQEFVEHQQAAKACIASRDYACAERRIAQAGKAAGSAKDKRTIVFLQQNLADAKTAQIEAERQARRAQEQAEERRRRREEEAEERAEEEQRRRWAEEAQQRASTPSPSFNTQGGDRILGILNKQNNALAEISRQQAAERQAQAEARARAEQRAEALRREQMEERRRRVADSQRQEDKSRFERESRQREHDRREAEAQQQAQRERERIKHENERAAAQAREEAQRKHEREVAEQKRKQEAADRLAAAQAEKAAEEKARNSYMSSIVTGLRLSAINCFGSTEVTGSVPKIKGADYCIDVYYTARCPGDTVGSKGVAKNFIGGKGCYGDTTTVSPKPACKADAVMVEVTDVRLCR